MAMNVERRKRAIARVLIVLTIGGSARRLHWGKILLYTEGVRWRWVFSSNLLPSTGRWQFLPNVVLRSAERVFCGLITALFPDDCRVCGEPLREVSRIPVCSRCLHEPEAMDAEFFCVACKTPFLNEHPLDKDGRCALCRLGVAGFDGVYTFGSYEGTLRTLIHLFKYEKVHTLARPLGELLARSIPREEKFDAVVAMPLHWRRRWARGFNQADLLAMEIARRWGIPVVGAVRRVKATVPQAALTNAKRRKNMSGAFIPSRPLLHRVLGGFSFIPGLTPRGFAHSERVVRDPKDGSVRKGGDEIATKKFLQGARVLLIDDVMTTGATAAACARALKRAGAKHVTLGAVARTDRRVALTDFEFEEVAEAGNPPDATSAGKKSRKTAGGITT